MSKQLSLLEKKYGAPLINRTTHALTLTPAGKILYEKAKDLIMLEGFIERDIRINITENKAILRVGVTSQSDPLVSNLLLRFSESYPAMVFEVIESSSDNLFESMKNRITEIALIRTRFLDEHPNFQSVTSTEEYLMAICKPDNSWIDADAKTIPVEALQGVPLALSYGMYPYVNRAFLEHNLRPNVFSISTNRDVSLLWSEHDRAIAIVPTRDPSHYEQMGFRCLYIDSSALKTLCCVGYLKGTKLSPGAQLFSDFCQQYFQGFRPAGEGGRD